MGWKRISKHRAFQKEVSLLGMVWGGRREEGSGWGTHVYLWWIHLDIWQNQYNIVKFKNKIKLKKKKRKKEKGAEIMKALQVQRGDLLTDQGEPAVFMG